MGDKSPKQSTTKKPAGKSIKEKRLDKKAKTDTTSQMETWSTARSTDRPPRGAGRSGPHRASAPAAPRR